VLQKNDSDRHERQNRRKNQFETIYTNVRKRYHMKGEEDPASRILQALRFRPRGMTITDIARQTGIKRNSAAKYLEMLLISGNVECRVIGTARVFSLAHRVPLSSFLCFTRDLIVVLDSHGRISQVNDRFLEQYAIAKENVTGRTISEVSLPILSTPGALDLISGSGEEQISGEIHYVDHDHDADYWMEVIPTVFDDGSNGSTIVLHDISPEKQNYRNMEFLARTAMELVDMPMESSIYQYIAERVFELVPGAGVTVNAIDVEEGRYSIRAVADRNFHDALHRILGHDPVGLEMPMMDIFSGPHKNVALQVIKKGSAEFLLEDGNGPGSMSAHDICFQRIPEELCDEIMREQNIGKAKIFLLYWKDEFFGAVSIFLGRDERIENIHVVESFIRQSSIAISQRMTAARLRRSEERFREVVNISPHPISLIDRSGRYLFVNQAFTGMFGYTLEDIPDGREWFRLAYPDEEYRQVVIDTWKTDLANSKVWDFRPRRFRVRCRNGDEREVLFTPVTLSNGTQFVTYVDVSKGGHGIHH